MQHKEQRTGHNKKNTEVKYRRAVVTFLDILGFGNLVKKGTAKDVAAVLSAISKFALTEDSDEFDETSAFSVGFSDSIVRVRFLDGANERYSTGHVLNEILDLCHIQGELIPYDVIIRGGITVGDIYLKNRTIFGPAMVRAYELESKAAIYPRVVIDPVVLNSVRIDPLLRRQGNNGDEEISAIRKLIDRGDSGLWFVDYLRTIFGELDDPDLWPEVLESHKRLVIKRYAEKDSRTSYLDKLLWLAIYHNKVVSEIPDEAFLACGVKRSSFELKTKEIPELARMPKRTPAFNE
ncbi:hypothetical protein [Pseudomonas fluorescens]|uniref:Guanylate cyclase domain-containing protein n=1 Tax=Pseudomonas fluorescens TaxID=294 RepID=A0A0F4SWY9_PSEFL|nr:hypothetical protein [Pseudomonas fluorescens]KJZ36414.1 hypothetical protein VC34_26955 [Pseudomonas fluorescens]